MVVGARRRWRSRCSENCIVSPEIVVLAVHRREILILEQRPDELAELAVVALGWDQGFTEEVDIEEAGLVLGRGGQHARGSFRCDY